MISVDLGDGKIQWLDESAFEKRVTVTGNDHEHTEVVTYWLGDKCVHRSPHVRLKKGLGIEAFIGAFNGK